MPSRTLFRLCVLTQMYLMVTLTLLSICTVGQAAASPEDAMREMQRNEAIRDPTSEKLKLSQLDAVTLELMVVKLRQKLKASEQEIDRLSALLSEASDKPMGVRVLQEKKKNQPVFLESARDFDGVEIKDLYTIIESENLRDVKRSVRVRLARILDKDELAQIAIEIRNGDQRKYDRTFILYYLPGMLTDGLAWATTHFEPDLSVVVLGRTREEELASDKGFANTGQNTVGEWRGGWTPQISRTVLLETQDSFVLEYHLSDGSYVESVREINSQSGRKFVKTQKTSVGEYYLITKDGNLEFWDNDGKFAAATKID